jgi:hypothetical protein
MCTEYISKKALVNLCLNELDTSYPSFSSLSMDQSKYKNREDSIQFQETSQLLTWEECRDRNATFFLLILAAEGEL